MAKTLAEKRAIRSHKRQEKRIEKRAVLGAALIGERKTAGIAQTRERARQTRSIEKAKSVRKVEAASAITAQREASARKLMQEREAIRASRPPRVAPKPSRRQQFASGATDKAVDTATPSSNSNLIMVTIFTMAGLVIIYQLVTRGPAVSGFLGGAGDWFHAFSSNAPLFVAKGS